MLTGIVASLGPAACFRVMLTSRPVQVLAALNAQAPAIGPAQRLDGQFYQQIFTRQGRQVDITVFRDHLAAFDSGVKTKSEK